METVFKARNDFNFLRNKTTEGNSRVIATEVPLSKCKSGDIGRVIRIDGGEEFRSKMLALGVIPGKTIIVAKGEKEQPFLLRIDDSRVMMDWRTLEQIYVLPGRF